MKNHIFASVLVCALAILPSCLENNDIDNTEWYEQNQKYLSDCESLVENGENVYTRVTASWAPGTYVLMHWHNDRSATASNLRPLSNSTVNVKYELETIDGTKVQNSYSSTTYGDSIYQSRPDKNIIGFWIALTNMHVGDSVTMVIPPSAGYGNANSGTIKPYSTLIYHVKLKSIPKYELP